MFPEAAAIATPAGALAYRGVGAPFLLALFLFASLEQPDCRSQPRRTNIRPHTEWKANKPRRLTKTGNVKST